MGSAKGLTLIETVMTIVIAGIIAGIFMFSTKGVMDLWNFWSFRSETVSQTRLAAIRMVREIRQIRNSTSIFTADRSRLRFEDTNNQTVDYSVNGANLIRNGDILAAGLSGMNFTYYNISGVQLSSLPLDFANRTQVYTVRLNMSVSSGDQSKTVNAQVYLRNYQ